MLDQKLLTILACPQCHGGLVQGLVQGSVQADCTLDAAGEELLCLRDALAFPVRDGVPVMLINEARDMTLAEVESAR